MARAWAETITSSSLAETHFWRRNSSLACARPRVSRSPSGFSLRHRSPREAAWTGLVSSAPRASTLPACRDGKGTAPPGAHQRPTSEAAAANGAISKPIELWKPSPPYRPQRGRFARLSGAGSARKEAAIWAGERGRLAWPGERMSLRSRYIRNKLRRPNRWNVANIAVIRLKLGGHGRIGASAYIARAPTYRSCRNQR